MVVVAIEDKLEDCNADTVFVRAVLLLPCVFVVAGETHALTAAAFVTGVATETDTPFAIADMMACSCERLINCG